MKKVLFSVLFAASAAMGLSACMNGDYDANPNGTNSGPNPLGGTGGNGGGGGGGSNNFNWTGTDPMSAKIDGTAWQATSATYMAGAAGFSNFVSGSGPNSSAIIVTFPDNAAANTTHTFNSSNTASWSANTSGSQNDVYAAALGGGGSVLIMENDATHVKGKFTFNAKNIAGTSANVTEGYFNVTK